MNFLDFVIAQFVVFLPTVLLLLEALSQDEICKKQNVSVWFEIKQEKFFIPFSSEFKRSLILVENYILIKVMII